MNLAAANQLFLDGTVALSHIEANGMRVDVEYFKQLVPRLERRIKSFEAQVMMSREGLVWLQHFGNNLNLNSDSQLAVILYEDLKLPIPLERNGELKAKTDAETLRGFKLEITEPLIQFRKFGKAVNTYIKNIMLEEVDGVIHPFFNLNTVTTYRSSSDRPNFQNIPIRDPEIGRMIRQGFLPRSGNRLVEVDFGGIEVKIAACYHQDPAMLEYIRNPEKDLHRDMSAECYAIPVDQVTKKIRYQGKNKFVFPQFYGDYWRNCARAMWEAAMTSDLPFGEPSRQLREHLAARFHTLSQFEKHIEEVEKRFWYTRFPTYRKWKEDWYERYLRCGFFDLKTGFRCSGILGKNDVINYPVQGAAFHCLLWCLIQLERETRSWKGKIVGQIHDSIIGDFPPDEAEEFAALAKKIMTTDLPKAWDWIIVPLEVEVEMSDVDASWYDKKVIKEEEADGN